MRIVLADGETLDVERGQSLAGKEGVLAFASITGKKYRVRIPDYTMPEVKNAAGLYSKPGMDLIDLFIGSEGILGIISEISIGLIKLKKEPVAVLAFFNCESNALAYVSALRGMKERGVISVEYFGSNALDFIRPEFPALRQNLGAAVLCEAEAGRLDLMAEISALLERHGAVEDWCAATSGDRRDMKEFRHSLPEAVNLYLKQHDSHKISTDFVVPEPAFPEMMGRYRDAERKFRAGFRRQGAHCVLFGHIGDCHLHLNFITATEAERAYAKELHLDLAKAAVSLGGTISGEHGVGKKTVQVGARQAPYLELMYGRKGIEEISRAKGALDPGWLLNPGNMVPRKT